MAAPTIISFTVGALLLFFVVSGFDINLATTWKGVRASNPILYLIALVVYYCTFPFRGVRWRILLRNAGVTEDAALPTTWEASRLILLGWMVSAISWFRMGDAYRAYAYGQERGAPLVRTLGTVIAERFLDLATIFILIIAAFLLLYLDAERQPSRIFLYVALGLVVGAGLLLLVLQITKDRIVKILPGRLRNIYYNFYAGMMGSFQRIPMVTIWGLLGWVAEVGRLYFLVQATGLDVGIGLIVFVTIANAVLSAVPLTPGGLGVAEPGIAGLLALQVPWDDAVTLAFLDRSISYLSLILFGSIAFILHQRAARSVRKTACGAVGSPVVRKEI